MSSPSSIEDRSISKYPFNGLLSKRLPFSRYVSVCPRYADFSENILLYRSVLRKTDCAFFRAIAARDLSFLIA